MPNLDLLVFREGELAANLQRELRELMRNVWGEPGSDGVDWADPQWRILVRRNGELVSHVGLLEREVQVGDLRVSVGGVCGVVTRPDRRGCGYAGRALRRAEDFMRGDVGLDFGMLTCKHEMKSFYTRCGWRASKHQAICQLPSGPGVIDGHVTMVLECSDVRWPPGSIDLLGTPW